jgi:hypothetical protein
VPGDEFTNGFKRLKINDRQISVIKNGIEVARRR